jgi:hypothetical protein
MALDPYSVLRVSREASEDEVRAAYRKRAREVHPDQGGSAAAFIAVKQAYESIQRGDTLAAERIVQGPGPSFKDADTMRRNLDDMQRNLEYLKRVYADAEGTTQKKEPQRRRPQAVPVVPFQRPQVSVWLRGSVVSFAAFLVTCFGRGYGLLPHHTLAHGQYLILGNYVTTSASLVQSSGFGNSVMVRDTILLALLSLFVSVPWLVRSMEAVRVRWYEYMAVGVVLAVATAMTKAVVTEFTGAILVGGCMVWVGFRVVALVYRVLITSRKRT